MMFLIGLIIISFFLFVINLDLEPIILILYMSNYWLFFDWFSVYFLIGFIFFQESMSFFQENFI
jgi:hypothetical protein